MLTSEVVIKIIVHILSNNINSFLEELIKVCVLELNLSNLDVKNWQIKGVEDIEHVMMQTKNNDCVIVHSLINKTHREYINNMIEKNVVPVVDLTGPVINVLGTSDQGVVHERLKKLRAIEFTINNDDGARPEGLLKADIVIVGVSRTAKTPLCLLLANHGYKAMNLPLVPEASIPGELFQVDKSKVIGITIAPSLLYEIRKERLKMLGLKEPFGYVSKERILIEMEYADKVMQRLGCTVIDVTNKAVEETAHKIISMLRKVVM